MANLQPDTSPLLKRMQRNPAEDSGSLEEIEDQKDWSIEPEEHIDDWGSEEDCPCENIQDEDEYDECLNEGNDC